MCPESGLKTEIFEEDQIPDNIVDFALKWVNEDKDLGDVKLSQHLESCKDCTMVFEHWVYIFENSKRVLDVLENKGILKEISEQKEREADQDEEEAAEKFFEKIRDKDADRQHFS